MQMGELESDSSQGSVLISIQVALAKKHSMFHPCQIHTGYLVKE